MESIQAARTCARIAVDQSPVVQELLLFWPIGSIAGWRSFAILFIDDAGLLRDSSLSLLVGGGMGASRETAVMAP